MTDDVVERCVTRLKRMAIRKYGEACCQSEEWSDAEELATLSAAPQVGEWQPIETAPKDGTAILVYRDGEYAVAMWRNPFFDTQEQAEWLSVTAKGPDGYGSVTRMEARYPYERVHSGTPTHWMPLPQPPALTKESADGEYRR